MKNPSLKNQTSFVGVRMNYLDLVIQGMEFQDTIPKFCIRHRLVFLSHWKLFLMKHSIPHHQKLVKQDAHFPLPILNFLPLPLDMQNEISDCDTHLKRLPKFGTMSIVMHCKSLYPTNA